MWHKLLLAFKHEPGVPISKLYNFPNLGKDSFFHHLFAERHTFRSIELSRATDNLRTRGLVAESTTFSYPAGGDSLPSWLSRQQKGLERRLLIGEKKLISEADIRNTFGAQTHEMLLKFAARKLDQVFAKIAAGETALLVDHRFLIEAAVSALGVKNIDTVWVIFAQMDDGKIIVIHSSEQKAP